MADLNRLEVAIERFTYPDGTRALGTIRFGVPKGEFCAILGANGSGKTTLLRLLDGLVKHYDGSVRLDGREVRSLHPKEIYRTVGLVFQNPDDQLFAATPFEDVAFGPRNMGFAEAEVRRRVEAALTSVGMAEGAQRPLQHLSYGQKKRVCIAGLLAMGHEVLLLDEPTAGLDPLGEERMLALLRTLNREQGVTIVMATHAVDLVPLFADRIHILSRGELARSGTPAEVFVAADELAAFELRLPLIAELFSRLRGEDGLLLCALPLTVGAARQTLAAALHGERR